MGFWEEEEEEEMEALKTSIIQEGDGSVKEEGKRARRSGE